MDPCPQIERIVTLETILKQVVPDLKEIKALVAEMSMSLAENKGRYAGEERRSGFQVNGGIATGFALAFFVIGVVMVAGARQISAFILPLLKG